MNTMEKVKVNDTRQPALTRAVIRQTGRENLEDIARHGADSGFAGFTYYNDTVSFYKRNAKLIKERLEQDASDFGQGLLEMVGGFVCLKSYKLTSWEVAEAINGRGEMAIQVQNALAWYAAEEIARELNPDL